MGRGPGPDGEDVGVGVAVTLLGVAVGVGDHEKPTDDGLVVGVGTGGTGDGEVPGRVVVSTGAVEATGGGAEGVVEVPPGPSPAVPAGILAAEVAVSARGVVRDARSEAAPSAERTRVLDGAEPVGDDDPADVGPAGLCRVGSTEASGTEATGTVSPTALIGAPAELMAQVARLAVPTTATSHIAAPTSRPRRAEGFTPARWPAGRRDRVARRRPGPGRESMISCRLMLLSTPPTGAPRRSMSLAHCPNPTSRGYRPERGRDPAGGGRRRYPLRADPCVDRTWACRDVATGGFARAPGGDRRAP